MRFYFFNFALKTLSLFVRGEVTDVRNVDDPVGDAGEEGDVGQGQGPKATHRQHRTIQARDEDAQGPSHRANA